jgi:hypothetical protein
MAFEKLSDREHADIDRLRSLSLFHPVRDGGDEIDMLQCKGFNESEPES